jgi:acylglycerol lipase
MPMITNKTPEKIDHPEGAQMLYDAVSAVDKTIKIYDGLYHEVFNEPEHDRVLGDVKAWLEAHPGPRT